MGSGTIAQSGWDYIFRCWASGWNGRRRSFVKQALLFEL